MAKQELLVDFITSLDGYGAAEGWPGWWGLQGPEYLAWLDQAPERDYTILMGANTYRLMSGFAAASATSETAESSTDEEATFSELAKASKVVLPGLIVKNVEQSAGLNSHHTTARPALWPNG